MTTRSSKDDNFLIDEFLKESDHTPRSVYELASKTRDMTVAELDRIICSVIETVNQAPDSINSFPRDAFALYISATLVRILRLEEEKEARNETT